MMGMDTTSMPKLGFGLSCLRCGQCEGVCPQHMPIIKYLEEAAEKLEK